MSAFHVFDSYGRLTQMLRGGVIVTTLFFGGLCFTGCEEPEDPQVAQEETAEIYQRRATNRALQTEVNKLQAEIEFKAPGRTNTVILSSLVGVLVVLIACILGILFRGRGRAPSAPTTPVQPLSDAEPPTPEAPSETPAAEPPKEQP